MVYVTRLEMRGFKSFGNSKVSLPLAPGLTAVVGPNGHGKSNIVEAFRFVLGDMSAKTMRAERLSDLLFNGGKGGRAAPFAEVSLHFDNSNNTFPVDSKTLAVTRIVNRSGTCVYKINNKRASRQEIVDMLAPVISGPGGYNFVMQGDIDRFIKMDALDRRKIIDDIAGVAEYDEKREKALGQLQQVETNLQTMSGALNEIRAQMEKLREERDLALRHRELDAKLKQARSILLHIKRDAIERQLEGLRQKIKEREKSAEELSQKLKKINDETKRHERNAKELNTFIEQTQNASAIAVANELRSRISTLRELIVTAKNEYENLPKDIVRFQNELKKEMTKPSARDPAKELAKLYSEFTDLKQEFDSLIQKFEGAKTPAKAGEHLSKLRSVLNKMRNTVTNFDSCLKRVLEPQAPTSETPETTPAQLRAHLAMLEGRRSQLEKSLGELQQKITEAQNSFDAATGREGEVLTSIQLARKGRDQLEDKIKRSKSVARSLSEKITTYGKEAQSYRVQEAGLKVELDGANKEIQHFRVDVKIPPNVNRAKLESEIATLEARLGALGPINERAVRDFRNAERRFNAQNTQSNKLLSEKQTILDLIAKIDKKKGDVFMKTFSIISENFSKIFGELSPEGTARLVLENPEHPLDAGLDIEVRPAGKSVRTGAMSGGEKALTALALIFAIQRVKPTALYVLDEIDAHLDPENRQRVAKLLSRSSKQSQIVIVTLHDAMMATADRLFGVSMDSTGISRMLSVELSGYAA